MKILLSVFVLLPLFGQEPAGSPVPTPGEWLEGSIDVGYRWRTDVGGSYETYRSIVNLGSGPKLLGTEFTLLDPKKRLFDRMDVRAYDWGGDPYSTLHVGATKKKLYDFNADYRNIAYFNNLPSFADPLLSRGIVLNEQSFDTHRRLTSVELDLLPGKWIVPYLAFDQDSDSGRGLNAFVSDGNEYAVSSHLRNSNNNYRGGIRMEFRKFHVTLEQGGSTYKDDDDSNVPPGAANLGNRSASLLGTTLDLTSLQQAYGIRGSTIYSKGLFTANATSWLDLYGQFLFSQPDSSVNYQTNDTGSLAVLSQLLFYTGQQYLVSAEASLPHTSGSIGAEIRPFQKMRILESWLMDRLHTSSTANTQQTLTPVGVAPVVNSALSSALASNYNQEEVNVLFDVTGKLTLRAGYRYVWGDGNDVILPIAELTRFETGILRRNVGIGGVTYRPNQKISIHGDVEVASSGGAYFRTSLYNYQKLRILARYQVTPTLQLAADFNLLNNHNPTAGILYDYLAHQESLSAIWTPHEKKWDVQASYTRATIRSQIGYLDPGTLLPLNDLYRDNNHNATVVLDANLPSYSGLTPRISLGGSLFISAGSRPTSYYQPYAKLSAPLRKNLMWVSEWRYYGFGESFYGYEGFRSHLVTTGLRFTR